MGEIPLRRIIVKKLVSLFITLILAVSVLTVSTVAFAEESSREEVVFNKEYFENLTEISTFNKINAVSSKFSLNNNWLKDSAKVNAVFSNANYVLDTSEGAEEFAVTSESDKVFVEYCSSSKDYKDKWSCTKVTSDINVSSTGWWGFRYVLKTKDGTTSTSDENAVNVLARTSAIYVYFSDESAPVINKLHSDMEKAMRDGIKVGDTYTIKTNLSITDTSSTTTTYVVYKKVNGAWTENPVYDSKTKVVAEGFEDGISSAGVITMLPGDVLKDNEPVYKIVYTVRDSLGYETEVSTEQVLTLFAKAEEKEALTSSEIWQIVLYTIAGLSFVGIIVVLCIKPKEAVSDESQTSDGANKSNK